MENLLLKNKPELSYVLGALLGDGCFYHWKNQHQVRIFGDKKFMEKFANKVSICFERKINYYFYKYRYKKFGQKLWFVNFNNNYLYILFKEMRENLDELSKLIQNNNHSYRNSLQFIEGFFDAEGCVKIIKEEVRKTPKICLDITNTNYGFLELIKNLFIKALKIETRYSSQEAFLGKDGCWRKKIYHLRIYRKEHIRKFFENMSTTKLKPEKVEYVNNWLNNGK